jgi:hypothetical protein
MFLNINTKRLLNAGLITSIMLTLAACGKQPPECTSSDMGKTIKGILTTNMVQILKSDPKLTSESRTLAEKYLEGLKLSFGTVVEQGRDEKTKLRACKGDYTLSTLTGKQWEAEGTEWTAQVTADGKDFVVNLPRSIASGMDFRLSSDFSGYIMQEKKLAGVWDGKFSCTRTADAGNTTEPKRFDYPLKLTVKDMDVSGKVLTGGGNTNIFTGSINPFADEISLNLEIVNSEGVTLGKYGEFLAKINAGKVQMKLDDTCTLDLKHS